jgi:50S ribosomal subunit-associated GTPase HflX
MPELLSELGSMLRPVRELVELSIPHEDSALIARLHAVGQVVERHYNGSSARFKARIPPHLLSEFSAFVTTNGHKPVSSRNSNRR